MGGSEIFLNGGPLPLEAPFSPDFRLLGRGSGGDSVEGEDDVEDEGDDDGDLTGWENFLWREAAPPPAPVAEADARWYR